MSDIFVMYMGVETAEDITVNMHAQDKAHEDKTGRTYKPGQSRSHHAAACWRTWTSLTSEERIAYIKAAAETVAAESK